MNQNSSQSARRTRALVESAVMISLATVLSIFKLAELPYGGSITLASMLPILLVAYRHGAAFGFGAGIVYGIVQQLLGLKNLSYFTTWQSIVAIILLDYLVAFGVIGVASLFRRLRDSRTALLLGGLAASLLRYVCHVISGATVWAGLSIPTEAALAYSFIYNATYMIPETIVLLLMLGFLSSALDFRAEIPKRIAANGGAAPLYFLFSGLSLLAALVFDTVSVFQTMQDPESGEFTLAYLGNVDFMVVGIVSGVLFAASLLLFLLGIRSRRRKGH